MPTYKLPVWSTTTKPLVFAIKKYKFFVFFVFVFFAQMVLGQEKRESESCIMQEEFPVKAFSKMAPYLEDAKRIRFYREFDGDKTSCETKFKKGRLFYSVEFDSLGILEDVEFVIEENDIPETSWGLMLEYIANNFNRARIKKFSSSIHYSSMK